MPCAICGNGRTEDAHVRARVSFEDGADDRTWNIIPLCPSCHTEFDDGRIGISRDKRTVTVLKDDGTIRRTSPLVSIADVKDEYVEWKNQQCALLVRLALGIIPGYEHYGIEERLNLLG